MFERLLTSFQNILKIPELRTRILFTLGMLVVYRVGAHIPTPGINGEALSEFLQKQGGALLGFLDIFSGGSLSRLTKTVKAVCTPEYMAPEQAVADPVSPAANQYTLLVVA